MPRSARKNKVPPLKILHGFHIWPEGVYHVLIRLIPPYLSSQRSLKSVGYSLTYSNFSISSLLGDFSLVHPMFKIELHGMHPLTPNDFQLKGMPLSALPNDVFTACIAFILTPQWPSKANRFFIVRQLRKSGLYTLQLSEMVHNNHPWFLNHFKQSFDARSGPKISSIAFVFREIELF